MRLERSLTFAIFLSLLVGGGCLARPELAAVRATANADLFPLRPGDFWVYEVGDFEGHRGLLRVLVRGPFYLRTHDTPAVIVEESGGIDTDLALDVDWHPVVYYRRGDFLYKFSGVGYDEQEIREYRIGRGEEKVLPNDLARHPQWESDFQVLQLDPGTGYTLRSFSTAAPMAEPVTVRGGSFERCLRVETRTVAVGRSPRGRSEEILFRYTDWYAPGVGLVKSIVEVSDAPRPVNSVELLSFRAGEPRD